MSLPFITQAIQTVQSFPLTQQTTQLREVHHLNAQLQKPLGRFKLENTFWNQDISKIEIETSRLLHEFAYSYKPDPIPQFNFEEYLQKKARLNITTEDYRQQLLEFYDELQGKMWLRRQYLLRRRITKLHQPTEDLLFYDPLVEKNSDAVPIEMYSTKHVDQKISQEGELKEIDEEILELDRKLNEYQEISEKLSNERIFDQQRFDSEMPQIQISADDDLIFERINSKVYQTMPFITSKHLKEYYNINQNRLVNSLDDVDTQIFIESLDLKQIEEQIDIDHKEYLIPITMPTLQEEIQELANNWDIQQDMMVDNGALFLFAIDKLFLNRLHEQSQKYLLFLPYNLETVEQKCKNFQQQTMNILNELKEEKIRKEQYRIRSSQHWVDSVQIIPEEVTEIEHILYQYEDSTINSWMKFLQQYECEKIIDKLNKDMSLIQEQTPNFPEIYFQFYLRYQKLLYLDCRQSLIEIMQCLNVLRTTQKNLNIYFVDLHHLKNQLTQEKIQKKQQISLSAFLTTIETQEINTIPTCSYLCEETITEDNEVIDGNGFRILNEIIFKDLSILSERIAHLTAFTLQFTIKIGEKNTTSDSQQLNRLKTMKEYLFAELQYLKAKCDILRIIMPLLQHADTTELGNAVSLLSQLIQQKPKYKYTRNLIDSYNLETHRLQKIKQILGHTKRLKLILKILSIQSMEALEQTYQYIKRDILIDKDFPFKFLYQDTILDQENNLNLIIRQMPDEGNFNIFSIAEFLKLRRKIYKLCLRIYYSSDQYMKQAVSQNIITKIIPNLELIPNRIVDENNFNMFEILLDEYIKLGKEVHLFESWNQLAADNYKMIDLLMLLKSLLLLDFFLFNAIKINRLQDEQFIDIAEIKEKIGRITQNNIRKQNIMPESTSSDKKQNVMSMISSQFKGAMMVKNFINKMATNQATILQEFNKQLLPYCVASSLTYQSILYREEQLKLNAKLPFVKHIFTEDPFMNEMQQIQNPFCLFSIKEIMGIMNYRDTEQKQQQKQEQINEDWYTTTKLKIEKNMSPLSPNKKASKFKSSGSPFSNLCKLNEPISSAQQLSLQLVYQLIGLQSSNCNVIDLVYFRQGMLHLEQLKRNQLRLRRDLEGLPQNIQKIQNNIKKISQLKSIVNINQTILTYLAKLIKRYNTLTLSTLISSIHQFRNDEGYDQIINQIRFALCSMQFRNAQHVEKLINETPRVYPSIQTKQLYSTKQLLLRYVFSDKYYPIYYTNPNNIRRPLSQLSEQDYHTQLNPFLVPTHQTLFRTQKLNYNVNNFIERRINLFPDVISNLFSLFPQSKIIYYSTIQDLVISEAEGILREKCIFEIDDIFKYERAYRKILLLQLRYLVLSEFFVVQKCKILPFQPTNQQDPCTQWLEQSVKLSEQYTRKQQLKAGLLFNIHSIQQDVLKSVNEMTKNQLSHKQQLPKSQDKFSILNRLRLQSFENQVFQLISILIASQAVIQQEGIEYLVHLNNQITSQQQPYEMIKQVNVFYNNLERDSLKIMTLNKGYAHVVADIDLNRHLDDLNIRTMQICSRIYPNHIQIENEQLTRMYNQKSLELRFANKKLKFYDENINHIVESLVAQRTNDLIFENDSLKQMLDNQQKQFDIEKQKLRDEVRQEFQESIRCQDVVFQEMQNRFNDYKRGISMELSSFITEYRTDGLKRVRDKASEALFGTVNKINIDLDQEFQRVEVYDQFKEESIQISSLFASMKKLRTFYLWREMCMKEKYERRIQIILSANSSNEELQQRIQELNEKLEILKDELIQNRKIITIMDNQNQILRRDLQKFKIDRFQAMREKGQLGAIATYKEQEEQLERQIEENATKIRPTTASLLKKPKQLTHTKSAAKLNNPKSNILQMKYKIAQ